MAGHFWQAAPAASSQHFSQAMVCLYAGWRRVRACLPKTRSTFALLAMPEYLIGPGFFSPHSIYVLRTGTAKAGSHVSLSQFLFHRSWRSRVRFVPVLAAAVRFCFPFPHSRGLVALVMAQAQFIPIPPGAVLAHYAQIAPGSYAVVTVSGSVLAPSFFDLREQYTATATINGAGCWVVLTPVIRSSSFSQEPQPTLF